MGKHCYYWFLFRFKFSSQHITFRRIPCKIIKCCWKKSFSLEKKKKNFRKHICTGLIVLDANHQVVLRGSCLLQKVHTLPLPQSPPLSITPHPEAECPLAGSIPLTLLLLVEFKRNIYPHTHVFWKWKKRNTETHVPRTKVSQTYFSKTKRRLLGLICQ